MRSVDVLIITAAEGEDVAVRRVAAGAVEPWEETDGPEGFPFAVWHRSYQARGGRILRVALVQAASLGGEAAALAAGSLVGAYRPTALAMCGVCAGRPDRVNLGDVIIADRVYPYDSGETVEDAADGRSVERLKPDLTTFQINARWKRAAEHFLVPEDAPWLRDRPRPLELQADWLLNELLDRRDPANPGRSSERHERCPDWRKVVDDLWKRGLLVQGTLELSEAGLRHVEAVKARHPDGLPEPPRFQIHVGPLATGNSVVKVPGFFDRLASQQRGVLGLDMEASAIGLAAHVQEVPRMIVVKGVLDNASPAKSDHVREFAARAAAEVLIGFLREHLEPREPSAAEIVSPPRVTSNPPQEGISGDAEPETSGHVSGGVTREDADLPPARAVPFSYLGVCWEVRERFFEVYRQTDTPNAEALRDAIHGPRCARCSTALTREIQHGWMADFLRSYRIQSPCPRCGQESAPPFGARDASEIRLDVYREAQRLAIRGEPFPVGECGRALRNLEY